MSERCWAPITKRNELGTITQLGLTSPLSDHLSVCQLSAVQIHRAIRFKCPKCFNYTVNGILL